MEKEYNNMVKFVIQKENMECIPCIADIPDNCTKIILLIHGLSSSKESENASYMMKYFAEKGIGVVAYDQPGHGTEEAANESLLLKNCLGSLAAVERYLVENYPDVEICYFGSSFGGYVLGIYLARKLNSGRKAFMRCAAVIFPQMIVGDVHAEPDPETIKFLNMQGYIDAMVDGQNVRFLKEFLEELKANSMIDIYNEELPDHVELSFVHGEKDSVVPVHTTKAFAEKHGYPIVIVPDEGHSISDSPSSPAIVADIAYEFFMGGVRR